MDCAQADTDRPHSTSQHNPCESSNIATPCAGRPGEVKTQGAIELVKRLDEGRDFCEVWHTSH